ncbi:MAG: hypothetical protein U5K31_14225 [Balneolaceae bacterium]|nr:hypothetical protein [Balneolaceae bacterium]
MSRRKIIFVIGLVLVQLALIWPVYPLFSGARPFILGLPLSFFWLIVVLCCAFGLLLWYYLTDPRVEDPMAAEE